MSNATQAPKDAVSDAELEQELEQVLGEGDPDQAEDALSESNESDAQDNANPEWDGDEDPEVDGDDDVAPEPTSFDAAAQGA